MLELERAPMPRRSSSYLFSLAAHAALAAAACLAPGVDRLPTPLERAQAEARDVATVRLVSPPPVWRPIHRSSPAPPRLSHEQRRPERFQAPVAPQTPVAPASQAHIDAPTVQVAAPPSTPDLSWRQKPFEVAAPQVRPAGFGVAPVAPAPSPRTLPVQAGGFGSAGPQSGPDTGSSRVTLAGFGAAKTRHTEANQAAVASGGFAAVKRREPSPSKRIHNPTPSLSPLRIESKPTPVYSQAARDRGVEGDVRLRVRFLASGATQVLEVVSSLGFGLDEAAAAAARGIRFRPAKRDGRPVDTVAIIRITFQTAS